MQQHKTIRSSNSRFQLTFNSIRCFSYFINMKIQFISLREKIQKIGVCCNKIRFIIFSQKIDVLRISKHLYNLFIEALNRVHIRKTRKHYTSISVVDSLNISNLFLIYMRLHDTHVDILDVITLLWIMYSADV